MMGDDGEKFGAWPTTWVHCWGKRRWVDRFFEALEANADWLTTTTPSTWLTDHLPIGRLYIPTGSYEEMGEWALPPEESLQSSPRSSRRPRRRTARRRAGCAARSGATSRSSTARSTTSTSRCSGSRTRSTRWPTARSASRALDHLYRGQSNDCYWHGLFGGVYIGHMRLATYHHLIAAEDLADTAAGTLEATDIVDLDLDGQGDVRLAGPGQVVAIDLTEGAGIGGWDIRPVRHALAAVMRRRPEAYHQTLRDHEAAVAPRRGGRRGRGRDAPASIHEIVTAKEADLSGRIHYDPYERRSGLVRFLAPGTTRRRLGDGSRRRAR